MDFSKQRREWTILRARFGFDSDEGRRYSNLIEGSLELETADRRIKELQASMERQLSGLAELALQ